MAKKKTNETFDDILNQLDSLFKDNGDFGIEQGNSDLISKEAEYQTSNRLSANEDPNWYQEMKAYEEMQQSSNESSNEEKEKDKGVFKEGVVKDTDTKEAEGTNIKETKETEKEEDPYEIKPTDDPHTAELKLAFKLFTPQTGIEKTTFNGLFMKYKEALKKGDKEAAGKYLNDLFEYSHLTRLYLEKGPTIQQIELVNKVSSDVLKKIHGDNIVTELASSAIAFGNKVSNYFFNRDIVEAEDELLKDIHKKKLKFEKPYIDQYRSQLDALEKELQFLDYGGAPAERFTDIGFAKDYIHSAKKYLDYYENPDSSFMSRFWTGVTDFTGTVEKPSDVLVLVPQMLGIRPLIGAVDLYATAKKREEGVESDDPEEQAKNDLFLNSKKLLTQIQRDFQLPGFDKFSRDLGYGLTSSVEFVIELMVAGGIEQLLKAGSTKVAEKTATRLAKKEGLNLFDKIILKATSPALKASAEGEKSFLKKLVTKTVDAFTYPAFQPSTYTRAFDAKAMQGVFLGEVEYRADQQLKEIDKRLELAKELVKQGKIDTVTYSDIVDNLTAAKEQLEKAYKANKELPFPTQALTENRSLMSHLAENYWNNSMENISEFIMGPLFEKAGVKLGILSKKKPHIFPGTKRVNRVLNRLIFGDVSEDALPIFQSIPIEYLEEVGRQFLPNYDAFSDISKYKQELHNLIDPYWQMQTFTNVALFTAGLGAFGASTNKLIDHFQNKKYREAAKILANFYKDLDNKSEEEIEELLSKTLPGTLGLDFTGTQLALLKEKAGRSKTKLFSFYLSKLASYAIHSGQLKQFKEALNNMLNTDTRERYKKNAIKQLLPYLEEVEKMLDEYDGVRHFFDKRKLRVMLSNYIGLSTTLNELLNEIEATYGGELRKIFEKRLEEKKNDKKKEKLKTTKDTKKEEADKEEFTDEHVSSLFKMVNFLDDLLQNVYGDYQEEMQKALLRQTKNSKHAELERLRQKIKDKVRQKANDKKTSKQSVSTKDVKETTQEQPTQQLEQINEKDEEGNMMNPVKRPDEDDTEFLDRITLGMTYEEYQEYKNKQKEESEELPEDNTMTPEELGIIEFSEEPSDKQSDAAELGDKENSDDDFDPENLLFSLKEEPESEEEKAAFEQFKVFLKSISTMYPGISLPEALLNLSNMFSSKNTRGIILKTLMRHMDKFVQAYNEVFQTEATDMDIFTAAATLSQFIQAHQKATKEIEPHRVKPETLRTADGEKYKVIHIRTQEQVLEFDSRQAHSSPKLAYNGSDNKKAGSQDHTLFDTGTKGKIVINWDYLYNKNNILKYWDEKGVLHRETVDEVMTRLFGKDWEKLLATEEGRKVMLDNEEFVLMYMPTSSVVEKDGKQIKTHDGINDYYWWNDKNAHADIVPAGRQNTKAIRMHLAKHGEAAFEVIEVKIAALDLANKTPFQQVGVEPVHYKSLNEQLTDEEIAEMKAKGQIAMRALTGPKAHPTFYARAGEETSIDIKDESGNETEVLASQTIMLKDNEALWENYPDGDVSGASGVVLFVTKINGKTRTFFSLFANMSNDHQEYWKEQRALADEFYEAMKQVIEDPDHELHDTAIDILKLFVFGTTEKDFRKNARLMPHVERLKEALNLYPNFDKKFKKFRVTIDLRENKKLIKIPDISKFESVEDIFDAAKEGKFRFFDNQDDFYIHYVPITANVHKFKTYEGKVFYSPLEQRNVILDFKTLDKPQQINKEEAPVVDDKRVKEHRQEDPVVKEELEKKQAVKEKAEKIKQKIKEEVPEIKEETEEVRENKQEDESSEEDVDPVERASKQNQVLFKKINKLTHRVLRRLADEETITPSVIKRVVEEEYEKEFGAEANKLPIPRIDRKSAWLTADKKNVENKIIFISEKHLNKLFSGEKMSIRNNGEEESNIRVTLKKHINKDFSNTVKVKNGKEIVSGDLSLADVERIEIFDDKGKVKQIIDIPDNLNTVTLSAGAVSVLLDKGSLEGSIALGGEGTHFISLKNGDLSVENGKVVIKHFSLKNVSKIVDKEGNLIYTDKVFNKEVLFRDVNKLISILATDSLSEEEFEDMHKDYEKMEFERDMFTSIPLRIKLLFADIRIGDDPIEIMSVYNTFMHLMTMMRTNTKEELMRVFEEENKKRYGALDFMKEVFARLEEKPKIFQQLLSRMYYTNNRMDGVIFYHKSMVVSQFDRKDKEVALKMWVNNAIKHSGLIKMTSNNTFRIVKEKAGEVREALQEFEQEQSFTAFENLLNKLGIKIPSVTKNILLKIQQEGNFARVIKDYNLNKFFDTVAKNIELAIDNDNRKIANDTKEDGILTRKNADNFQKFLNLFKDLSIEHSSTQLVGNKMISKFQYKRITNKVIDWLAENYESLSDRNIVKVLIDNTNILPSVKLLPVSSYMDSEHRAQKEFNRLSSADQLKVLLGYYLGKYKDKKQNKLTPIPAELSSYDNIIGMSLTHMPFITQSDSKHIQLMKYFVFRFDFDKPREEVLATMKEILYDYVFLHEVELMRDSTQKFMHAFPTLNSIFIEDGVSLISLIHELNEKKEDIEEYLDEHEEIKKKIIDEISNVLESEAKLLGEKTKKLKSDNISNVIFKDYNGKYTDFGLEYIFNSILNYHTQVTTFLGGYHNYEKKIGVEFGLPIVTEETVRKHLIRLTPDVQEALNTEDPDTRFRVFSEHNLFEKAMMDYHEKVFWNNLSKRAKMLISSGYQLLDDPEFDDKYHSIVIEEKEVSSDNIKTYIYITYEGKEREEAIKLYEQFKTGDPLEREEAKQKIETFYPELLPFMNIESTDGIAIESWRFALQRLYRMGAVSKAEYRHLYSLFEMQEKELEQFGEIRTKLGSEGRLEVSKPVYIDVLPEKRAIFEKMAQYVLTPELAASFKGLRKYYDIMKSTDKPSRIIFTSGLKVGGNRIIPLSQAAIQEGKVTKDMVDAAKLEESFKYFVMQQEKPNRFQEALDKNDMPTIVLATQMEKILMSEGLRTIQEHIFPLQIDKKELENIDIDYEEKDDTVYTNGEGIFKLYNYYLTELQQRTKKELDRLFGTTPAALNNGHNADVVRHIREMLSKQVFNTFSDAFLDITYTEDGKAKFKTPLFLLPIAEQVEKVLISAATKRILQPRLSGISFQLISPEGFELDKKKNQLLWHKKDWDGILQPYRIDEKGKAHLGQIFVPNRIVVFDKQTGEYKHIRLTDYIDEEGNLNLPDAVKKLFSFRIPTSGLQSGVESEVVGILSENTPDMIVINKEQMVQTGEDFDFDQRYTYMPVLIQEGDKLYLYKSEKTDEKSASEEIKKELVRDFKSKMKEISPVVGAMTTGYEEAVSDWLYNELMYKHTNKEKYRRKAAFAERQIANFSNSVTIMDAIHNYVAVKTEEYEKDENLKKRLVKINSRVVNRELDKIDLNNKLISMYNSVFSSTDNRVQKLLNRGLTVETMQRTADLVDKLMKPTEYKTGNSLLFQLNTYNAAKSGKIGVGIYSWGVITKGYIQTVNPDFDLGFDTFRMGSLQVDGKLGRVKNKKGKKSTNSIINESQNMALDNQKLGLMGILNLTSQTIPVHTLMHALGLSVEDERYDGIDYAALFISQPILRSLDEKYIHELRDSLLKQLKMKDEEYEDFSKKLDTHAAKLLTTKNLIKNLSEEDPLTQLAVLDTYEKLQSIAADYRVIMQIVGISKKGAGTSVFSLIDVLRKVEEMPEHVLDLFFDIHEDRVEGSYELRPGLFITPKTWIGAKLINLLEITHKHYIPLFGQSFFNSTLIRNLDVKDEEEFMRTMQRDFYKFMSMMGSPFNEDYIRKLFFGHTSLANYLLSIKDLKLFDMPFFNKLLFLESNDDTPANLLYGAEDNKVATFEAHKTLEYLYTHPIELPARIPGERYTTKDLIRDLAVYSLMSKNTRRMLQVIPNQAYKDLGFDKTFEIFNNEATLMQVAGDPFVRDMKVRLTEEGYLTSSFIGSIEDFVEKLNNYVERRYGYKSYASVVKDKSGVKRVVIPDVDEAVELVNKFAELFIAHHPELLRPAYQVSHLSIAGEMRFKKQGIYSDFLDEESQAEIDAGEFPRRIKVLRHNGKIDLPVFKKIITVETNSGLALYKAVDEDEKGYIYEYVPVKGSTGMLEYNFDAREYILDVKKSRILDIFKNGDLEDIKEMLEADSTDFEFLNLLMDNLKDLSLPSIKWVESTTFDGAYSHKKNTIYLNIDILDDSNELERVLTEELIHFYTTHLLDRLFEVKSVSVEGNMKVKLHKQTKAVKEFVDVLRFILKQGIVDPDKFNIHEFFINILRKDKILSSKMSAVEYKSTGKNVASVFFERFINLLQKEVTDEEEPAIAENIIERFLKHVNFGKRIITVDIHMALVSEVGEFIDQFEDQPYYKDLLEKRDDIVAAVKDRLATTTELTNEDVDNLSKKFEDTMYEYMKEEILKVAKKYVEEKKIREVFDDIYKQEEEEEPDWMNTDFSEEDLFGGEDFLDNNPFDDSEEDEDPNCEA